MNVIKLPMCGMCGKVMHGDMVSEFNGYGEFHISCWNEFVEDMEEVGEQRLEDFNENFDEIIDNLARYHDED